MVKKFLFDLNSFDDEPAAKQIAEEAPPPPPTFTEDDVAQAESDAYRRGRQDGFRESEEAISREIATLIGVMNTQLDDLLQQESRRQADYTENLIASLQSMYAQTVPTLVTHQAWPMLARMARDVIDQHKAATALEFIVPDIYVDTLKAHLEKLYGARAVQFAVRGDHVMQLGDCRINWLNGGAIQDMAALQTQILDRLNQLLAENRANSQDQTMQSPSRDDDSNTSPVILPAATSARNKTGDEDLTDE